MENLKEELKITSIEELKEYSNGNIVSLPPFGEDQPFVARMRRPSMLNLVKLGKIPNSLLDAANTLFDSGAQGVMNKYDKDSMNQLYEVIDFICEESFVEPTYQQIKEAGITLTDEQMLFVFSYSQTGVKQLESFR